MGTNMNKNLQRLYRKDAHRHTKRHSSSTIAREMHIKATVRHHLKLVEMAII